MLEKEYIFKILEFLKARNKNVFVAWQEESVLNGSIATIVNVSNKSIYLAFEYQETLYSISPGKNVLVRTGILLRPLLCNVVSKEKSIANLNYINIVAVDREKRRFLRINLEDPIDATVIISNLFFQARIIDISEAGAGIIINTNKPLDAFSNKYADIQFTLLNTIIRMKIRFAWISKPNFEQFFVGVEFLADSFQKDKIQKFMIDNMYNIEQEMLEFLSFL